MESGKAKIGEIKRFLAENRDVMLETNVIGSDFSFSSRHVKDLVFKIEPMVFYSSLTSQENAVLSVLFSMNDFLTSGTWPTFAMIDFERPNGAGEEYLDYMNSLINCLRERGIRVAAGHTGNYGNIRYGVSGAIALIGLERPVFSFRRIREDDTFFVLGTIGEEVSYFRASKRRSKPYAPEDLSIEKYITGLLKVKSAVHYIHDVSEGGLKRALQETSELTGLGFNVSSASLKSSSATGIRGYGKKLFSASSSGALILSVDSKRIGGFERLAAENGWKYFEVEKTGDGVTLDGKDYDTKDEVVKFLE